MDVAIEEYEKGTYENAITLAKEAYDLAYAEYQKYQSTNYSFIFTMYGLWIVAAIVIILIIAGLVIILRKKSKPTVTEKTSLSEKK